MGNRSHARLLITEVAVDSMGRQFLVEAGHNGVRRHKVDRDTRIPNWVGQAISRGDNAYVLVSFDHTETVRRIVAG